MLDAVYIIATLLAFGLLALMGRGLEKIGGESPDRAPVGAQQPQDAGSRSPLDRQDGRR